MKLTRRLAISHKCNQPTDYHSMHLTIVIEAHNRTRAKIT